MVFSWKRGRSSVNPYHPQLRIFYSWVSDESSPWAGHPVSRCVLVLLSWLWSQKLPVSAKLSRTCLTKSRARDGSREFIDDQNVAFVSQKMRSRFCMRKFKVMDLRSLEFRLCVELLSPPMQFLKAMPYSVARRVRVGFAWIYRPVETRKWMKGPDHSSARGPWS